MSEVVQPKVYLSSNGGSLHAIKILTKNYLTSKWRRWEDYQGGFSAQGSLKVVISVETYL